MKRRPSLLKQLWRKVRGHRAKEVRATDAKASLAASRKVVSSLEPLEGRIAPAAVINPTTLTYVDHDGDKVTVKFSHSVFTAGSAAGNLALASAIFKFDNAFATTTGQQLELVDFTLSSFSGVVGSGLSITAVKAGGGNGAVDVGYINSTGTPLGAVVIGGDLGRIDAGASHVATGLASLKVNSLGVRSDTQSGTPSLQSNITGALGSLTVLGDVHGASIHVLNGLNASNQTALTGKIGSVTIGGSLRGRTNIESASDNTGLINAAASIGAVKIGTHATDGIFGGGGMDSGRIHAAGNIASVTVHGNVTGSGGVESGTIATDGTLGPVNISGSLQGGAAMDSGAIKGFTLGTITIGGSIQGGGDSGTGVVSSEQAIGAVKITGDIDGTTMATASSINVAGIEAGTKIASITVLGTLKGGAHDGAGFIDAGSDIGAIIVGAITGGAGTSSAAMTAGGKIASITVNHDVIGGGGVGSGAIVNGNDPTLPGNLGPVKIAGKLAGGTGDSSGSISSGGKIASVSIGPAAAVNQVLLQGNSGNFSGAIVSHGAMGAVRITGHVEGGAGNFSGSIWSEDLVTPSLESAGDLGAVTISGHVKGGGGADSGEIRADGNLANGYLASVTTGDLTGASGLHSGSIRAGQGKVHPGTTGPITVKGTLTGVIGSQSGFILSEGRIASVLVKGAANGGSVRSGADIGSVTFDSSITTVGVIAVGPAVKGATTDLAIGRITVLGDATGSRFRAGYTTSPTPVNPDAQMGPVFVKGNWTGGDIIAGVMDGGAPGFGTVGDAAISGPGTQPNNPKILSRIASIVIGGTVDGTAAVGDHFGFTAQQIGSFKDAAISKTFNPAIQDPPLEVAATTGDVTVREVA